MIKKTSPESAVATILLLSLVCTPVVVAEESRPTVSGRVVGEERPVNSAEVYAYEVATYALEKVTTDQKGQFLFKALPAGLYKIIAHKQGFVPTVELLLRRRPDAHQFMELRLAEDKAEDVRTAESYWDVRARIPADVLRQIQQVGLERTHETGLAADNVAVAGAQVRAGGGAVALGDGYGDAQLTDAEVALRGAVGGTQVAFDGRLQELSPTGEVPTSEVRSMALSLEGANESRLSFVTADGALAEKRGEEVVPVGMTHYQLQWSGPAAGGNSTFSAQLIDESNYFNAGSYAADLPEASRTLNLEGTFSRDVSRITSLTTGLTYRQRESYRLLGPDGSLRDGAGPLNDEVVGVYGVAGSRIQPRVLVEYGVFSSVREGGLSLMPTGGMVVDLGSDWKARGSFAQRVEREPSELPHDRFSTAFYDDGTTCHEIGDACYEVMFARGSQGEETLAVGAIHRQFAETLRLYFSDDFFNRLESLLVVPGDEIPELKFRMVRRVTPKILAKLESNIASGGGGVFYATDDRTYENQVRYLVTSLDTQFQRTSTGVFLAFHHLEQAFNPVSEGASQGDESLGSEVEIQRLQLMLTQDLSALANIAPSLAVRFNMELSRGASPFTLTSDDEVHKKLTGGISVSF